MEIVTAIFKHLHIQNLALLMELITQKPNRMLDSDFFLLMVVVVKS